MRLFCYYAVHTFVNTIRKVLKTWVAVFLACLALGVVVGLGVGLLIPDSDDKKDEKNKTSITAVTDDEKEAAASVAASKTDADATKTDASDAAKSKDHKTPEFLTSRGRTKTDLVDLIITGVFLLTLAANISSAKSSGRIFKPADVPMLFASPMKPQSVLMFRLVSTLAASLALSLYMIFQLPNLMQNGGFSAWGAVSMLIAYALVLIFGTLVQITFYTIMSRTKYGTGGLGKVVIAVYAAIAGVSGIYMVATGKDTLTAAFDFFANKNTYWIPFWGWMRGFVCNAIDGNIALSLLFLALFIFACVLVIVMIWKVPADFYEDAMVQTEKQAAIMENAKNASKGVAVVREKDRSDKLERDGFRHGFGANVFLHKAIFNRLRFAKWKVFSVTMVVFTFTAAFTAWIAGRNDMPFEPFLIPACALTFMMFYRTLGNPLKEDTSREFFILIPESPLKKIWYSLLGSVLVNAIDLVVPVIVAGVMLGTSPLTVLGWFLFILSVSLYGTAVGTFVDLSVPGDVGSTIKTFVQIMLLYFGLLPAAVFIIAGIVLKLPFITLVIGTLVDVGIGALFTLLTPHFLSNR